MNSGSGKMGGSTDEHPWGSALDSTLRRRWRPCPPGLVFWWKRASPAGCLYLMPHRDFLPRSRDSSMNGDSDQEINRIYWDSASPKLLGQAWVGYHWNWHLLICTLSYDGMPCQPNQIQPLECDGVFRYSIYNSYGGFIIHLPRPILLLVQKGGVERSFFLSGSKHKYGVNQKTQTFLRENISFHRNYRLPEDYFEL